MAENFLKLKKETDFQVQKAQRIPNKMKPKRVTSRHIIIRMAKFKDKERILKAREKQRVTYKRTSTRLLDDFFAETLQARREWHDIFKMLKGKKLQPRILYSAGCSFRIEGQITSQTSKN